MKICENQCVGRDCAAYAIYAIYPESPGCLPATVAPLPAKLPLWGTQNALLSVEACAKHVKRPYPVDVRS